MITSTQLAACGIDAAHAALFAAPVSAACARFDIDSPLRCAAFVAQCAHESTGFTRLSEGLTYTHADHILATFGSHAGASVADCERLVNNPILLGNTVYANRLGNGGVASGDGYEFRGAGLIQLTGREQQVQYAAFFERELPDFVAWIRTPEGAAMTAGRYWQLHAINRPADDGNIDGCTRLINPAMAGAGARRALYAQALAAFHVEPN